MFGIFPPRIAIKVFGGKVTEAKVIPGLWNPGMYASVPGENRRQYDADVAAAEEQAAALVGTDEPHDGYFDRPVAW